MDWESNTHKMYGHWYIYIYIYIIVSGFCEKSTYPMFINKGREQPQLNVPNMHKIVVIECASSCLKNYTQLFEFNFKI